MNNEKNKKQDSLTPQELNILQAWCDSREFGAAHLLKRLLQEHAELKAAAHVPHKKELAAG